MLAQHIFGVKPLLYNYWTWGRNNYGNLGLNNTTSYSSPVQIPGTTWNICLCGSGSMWATQTDGTLWAWGAGGDGNLGQNDRTSRSSPVQIPGTTWESTQNGYSTILATKTDGTLWGIGNNENGPFGLNDVVNYSSPVQIPGTWKTGYQSKTVNYYYTGAIKSDGTLWMMGLGNKGQLGVNNTTRYSSPVQVPGTAWHKLSGMQNSSVSIQRS